MPLSRFLIEAASDGCDLATRRGPRPHGQQRPPSVVCAA